MHRISEEELENLSRRYLLYSIGCPKQAYRLNASCNMHFFSMQPMVGTRRISGVRVLRINSWSSTQHLQAISNRKSWQSKKGLYVDGWNVPNSRTIESWWRRCSDSSLMSLLPKRNVSWHSKLK